MLAAGEADADQAGAQRIEAGGLGVDGEASGAGQAFAVGREGVGVEGFVDRPFAGDLGLGLGGEAGDLEAEALEGGRLGERGAVDREAGQGRHVGDVDQGDQPAGQSGLGHEGGEVLGQLALVGGGKHRLQGVVLGEQLGGGLRPDSADAGHVVGGVADQTEVVDNLFWADAFFGEQLGGAALLLLDRVVGAHAFGDDLVDVLVAGVQAHVEAGGLAEAGVGEEHIVGFVAGHAHHRHVHGREDLEHIGDLQLQRLGHRVAMRLVLREDVVAEIRRVGVEDAQQMGDAEVGLQFAHEVGEGEGDAGGMAVRPRQRRHAEVVAVGVIMAVDDG